MSTAQAVESRASDDARVHDTGPAKSLAALRTDIDAIDDSVVRLLSRRLTLVRSAAELKPTRDAVGDPARVSQVLGRVRAAGPDGDDGAVILELYRRLLHRGIGLELSDYDALHADESASEPLIDPGLFATMSTTRAMRRLRPEPVPASLLQDLVRAATWAPSGANRQAFTFVVVTERDQIARIAGLWERAAGFYCDVLAPNTCGSQDLKARAAMEHQRQHFADVPAVIFACYRPSRFGSRLVGNMRALRRVPGTLGVIAALRLLFRLRRWSDHAAAASVYPAVENLLLAARARGLGATLTTWHFALEPSFAAVLGLPRGQRIYAAIPVGYPVGRFGPVARKPVSEALRWEHWAPNAEPGR